MPNSTKNFGYTNCCTIITIIIYFPLVKVNNIFFQKNIFIQNNWIYLYWLNTFKIKFMLSKQNFTLAPSTFIHTDNANRG